MAKQKTLEQLLRWAQKEWIDIHFYGVDPKDDYRVKVIRYRGGEAEIWAKTLLQALRAAYKEWSN